ncbi:hypothetical protein LPTSP4_05940 [Leptospira ryugenii]|uniref:Uncharacterized protein n=1 Tax=Leptospira ryugenii TaxID=1917863 RepID=A0A2P2DWS1_9LEPT|nr:hypothetical protein [Leptospira ryugenii]GBF49084.1 hypothetical protein LPTSP4_05940 [Leptospira ryugenii]
MLRVFLGFSLTFAVLFCQTEEIKQSDKQRLALEKGFPLFINIDRKTVGKNPRNLIFPIQVRNISPETSIASVKILFFGLDFQKKIIPIEGQKTPELLCVLPNRLSPGKMDRCTLGPISFGADLIELRIHSISFTTEGNQRHFLDEADAKDVVEWREAPRKQ